MDKMKILIRNVNIKCIYSSNNRVHFVYNNDSQIVLYFENDTLAEKVITNTHKNPPVNSFCFMVEDIKRLNNF